MGNDMTLNFIYRMALTACAFFIVSCAAEQTNASNTPAPDTRLLKQVAKTPPMGWNSFDAYDSRINEAQYRKMVDFIAEHLKPYGWEYAVIDYIWWHPEPGSWNTPEKFIRRIGHPNMRYNEDGSLKYPELITMDENGRLLPAVKRFPSAAGGKGFKPLADYVHSKGLKFGIHIMRGIHRRAHFEDTPILGTQQSAKDIAEPWDTCAWNNHMFGVDHTKPGAQEYYNSIFKLYAEWGVDFIKADDMMGTCGKPHYGYHEGEVEMLHNAIENSGRPMVLSLSCGQAPISRANHLVKNANMWRISADAWDKWADLSLSFELLDKWSPFIQEHHWPDADMIPFGRISLDDRPHGPERMSKYTVPEHYTLMTLFSIARSPLMIGADLPTTPFETIQTFFMNEEVLAVNQASTDNRQVKRVEEDHAIWIAKDQKSDDRYLALFNLGEEKKTVTFKMELEYLRGKYKVRDLWAKKDLGVIEGSFSAELDRHGAGLYKLTKL